MTAPMPERCCGKCRHAKTSHTFKDIQCVAVVPWWVGEITTRDISLSVMLLPEDGTDCPAFEEKGSPND